MDILDVDNLNGGFTDVRDLNDKQLTYQTSLQTELMRTFPES